MKKLLFTLVLALVNLFSYAASFRTYVAHSLSGSTYTIWVNSDTAPGEKAVGQICNNGGNPFTGFVDGTMDNTVMGANWKIIITITSQSVPRLELANRNEPAMGANLYGFTGCNIVMSTVLANELTSFAASKQEARVVLSWLTANEKANDVFYVERSNNGKSFTSIGNIKGAGNSAVQKSYAYTDIAPLKGINYYRLKSKDFDGKESMSQIVSLLFANKSDKFSISPNPVANASLRLDYDAAINEDVTITIIDAIGKVVKNEKRSVVSGSNSINLVVNDLANGYYFIRLNDDVQKFIKN